jgi:hypothetical protein
MPKRMIRDWTASKKVNKISAHAERFFIRLMMKADDFGNYPANIKLINGTLFPEIAGISDRQCADWLKECINAGLLFTYQVNQTAYIHIIDFGQRLDRASEKYPREPDPPPEDAGTFREDAGEAREVAGIFPPELEVELEEEVEEEVILRARVVPSFDDFWNCYDKKVDRPKCEQLWKRIDHHSHEKIMQYLIDYIPSTADKKFRKNPATFLQKKSWNDEIIKQQNGTGKQIDKASEHVKGLIDDFNKRHNG